MGFHSYPIIQHGPNFFHNTFLYVESPPLWNWSKCSQEIKNVWHNCGVEQYLRLRGELDSYSHWKLVNSMEGWGVCRFIEVNIYLHMPPLPDFSSETMIFIFKLNKFLFARRPLIPTLMIQTLLFLSPFKFIISPSLNKFLL